MLKGEEIIYIANDWFAENKTSSHHIAEILARKNKILYIEASGQRAPRASKRDIRKIFTKLRKAWKSPIKVQNNIYLYSPLILPFHKYPIVRKINKFILNLTLKFAYEKVDFKNPILWIFMPHFFSIIGSLNSKGTVYYCVDEYSAQPNVNIMSIKEMEKYLLSKVDVAFTVSEELLEKKSKINSNTYLSLHGVDIEHFKKALDETTSIPEDITPIPRPIVGFFGLIEQRVDLDLMKFIAENRPNLSFVFIGLVAQDVSMFKKYPNVYFLGVRPYKVLPNYLKVFNVAIMPYKLNTEMINSNPKKLKEYLAGGKAVVSVRIREVERYKEFVYIADSYEEFLGYIDLALKEDSPEMISARVKAMEQESWEAKVEYISQIVSKHIPGVYNE